MQASELARRVPATVEFYTPKQRELLCYLMTLGAKYSDDDDTAPDVAISKGAIAKLKKASARAWVSAILRFRATGVVTVARRAKSGEALPRGFVVPRCNVQLVYRVPRTADDVAAALDAYGRTLECERERAEREAVRARLEHDARTRRIWTLPRHEDRSLVRSAARVSIATAATHAGSRCASAERADRCVCVGARNQCEWVQETSARVGARNQCEWVQETSASGCKKPGPPPYVSLSSLCSPSPTSVRTSLEPVASADVDARPVAPPVGVATFPTPSAVAPGERGAVRPETKRSDAPPVGGAGRVGSRRDRELVARRAVSPRQTETLETKEIKARARFVAAVYAANLDPLGARHNPDTVARAISALSDGVKQSELVQAIWGAINSPYNAGKPTRQTPGGVFCNAGMRSRLAAFARAEGQGAFLKGPGGVGSIPVVKRPPVATSAATENRSSVSKCLRNEPPLSPEDTQREAERALASLASLPVAR